MISFERSPDDRLPLRGAHEDPSLVLYKSQKLINVTERRCGRCWTGVKIGHDFQRDATHKLIRRESEGRECSPSILS